MRRKDGSVIEVHKRQQYFFDQLGEPSFSIFTFDRVRYIPAIECSPAPSLKRKRPQPTPSAQQHQQQQYQQQQDASHKIEPQQRHQQHRMEERFEEPQRVKRKRSENAKQPLLLTPQYRQHQQYQQHPQHPQGEENKEEGTIPLILRGKDRQRPLYYEANASSAAIGEKLFGPLVNPYLTTAPATSSASPNMRKV